MIHITIAPRIESNKIDVIKTIKIFNEDNEIIDVSTHIDSYGYGQKDQFINDVQNYSDYIDLIEWDIFPQISQQ